MIVSMFFVVSAILVGLTVGRGDYGSDQNGIDGGSGGDHRGFGRHQRHWGDQLNNFNGYHGEFDSSVNLGGSRRDDFTGYDGLGGDIADFINGDNVFSITFPFPTFLHSLNRTNVRKFKQIVFNNSATSNQIESELQNWANNQSSKLQSEISQWIQNVVNFTNGVVVEADKIANNLAENGQALYKEVKAIKLNNNLTHQAKCSELIKLTENSTVGVVLEVIQTFPLLLNSCDPFVIPVAVDNQTDSKTLNTVISMTLVVDVSTDSMDSYVSVESQNSAEDTSYDNETD